MLQKVITIFYFHCFRCVVKWCDELRFCIYWLAGC